MSEKLCIFCKYWNFSSGSTGYSEMTPGWGASMYCMKGKWKGHPVLDDLETESFRELMQTANTCADYSPPSMDK